MDPKRFFTKEQQEEIRLAIAAAELNTSGEIRVHIDGNCKEDVLIKAAGIFHELKMDKTALHNGVLFYLAVNDHKFAILGDKGINEKVPPDFWDLMKEMMEEHFIKHEFTVGLCKGIKQAGEKLKAYFPLQGTDTNELSNEVIFGKENQNEYHKPK